MRADQGKPHFNVPQEDKDCFGVEKPEESKQEAAGTC